MLLLTVLNFHYSPPKDLYSLSANIQVTMTSVHRAKKLLFYAATWEALKSQECRAPLRDKEPGTERTKGQMVHFSTSCVAVHYHRQSEQKIRSASQGLNDTHLPSSPKLDYMKMFFLFWMSLKIWIMRFFLWSMI